MGKEYAPGTKYDPITGERLFVVRSGHSGFMSESWGTEDESKANLQPMTKAEAQRQASDANAYNGIGSTTWHYAEEA